MDKVLCLIFLIFSGFFFEAMKVFLNALHSNIFKTVASANTHQFQKFS